MTYLTYDELIQLDTFEDRFNYLKVNGRTLQQCNSCNEDVQRIGGLRHDLLR